MISKSENIPKSIFDDILDVIGDYCLCCDVFLRMDDDFFCQGCRESINRDLEGMLKDG